MTFYSYFFSRRLRIWSVAIAAALLISPLIASTHAEVSVFEYIPAEEHEAIRDYSSSSDLSDYVHRALRDMPSRGENILRFPCGLYHFSVILPEGNLTLRGCGNKVSMKTERASILRPSREHSKNGLSEKFIFKSEARNYLQIEGFAIDGMQEVDSALHFAGGIDITVNNNYFYHVPSGKAAIRGGGLIFFRSKGNTFSMEGFAYDLQDRYSHDPDRSYYGVNVGWIEENVVSAGNGVRLGGTLHFNRNDVELAVNAPARAALELCEPTAVGHYTVTGNYFELKKGSAEPLAAIIACYPKVIASENVIFGDSSAGSVGINLKSGYVYSATVKGNSINRVETGILFLGTESTGSNADITANTFNHVARWIDNHGGKGLFFDETGWHFQDGSVRFGLSRIFKGDPLDLSRGNVFQVNTSGELLSEVVHQKPGMVFVLFFKSPARLNSSQFELCDGDTFAAGESVLFFTDENSRPREVCRRMLVGEKRNGEVSTPNLMTAPN